MRNSNHDRNRQLFWMKVATVGIVAGLIGGGIFWGVQKTISSVWPTIVSTVASGFGSSGGAKVHNSKVATSSSTKAYNKVKGAVVSVINQQSTSTSNMGDFGYASSSSSTNSSGLETAAEGSGVIYKKSAGTAYIVTNNHVVSGASAVSVILASGRKVSAKIVGTDETTDLAVLKISASHVKTVAEFGNSKQVQAGQDVLAIGSPMGTEYANSVTKGIVSAVNRTIRASDASVATKVIQTDTAINSGNSGGPLINMVGQVIGINSMKLSSSIDGTSVEGMGFAIPSNEVVSVINQLVKNGSISRPSLGISMLDLDSVTESDQTEVLKLPTNVTSGVVVMSVTDDGAAAKAGLSQYDVITKFGKTTVTDASDLRTALYKYKVGDRVKITYYHDGQEKTATVTLSEASNSSSSTNS